LRAGLAAGTLAAICSVLAFNALVGLVGAASVLATAPWAREVPARVVADQRHLVPLVASVLEVVPVGAAWGAVYGRWGEPLLGRLVPGDAARGIAFSTIPWGLTVAAVILITAVDDLDVLVHTPVQAFHPATLG